MAEKNMKTVLFYGVNTPGHINALLAIADKLKADHGYRTVFLSLGPTMDNSVEKHGHESYILEEKGALEDYEISEDEDSSKFDVSKENSGKQKINLTGYSKYEHLIRKHLGDSSSDPVARFFEAMGYFMGILQSETIDNHETLATAINQINPDLIIADVFMVPPSILTLKKVPWVKLCSANPLGITRPTQALGVKPPAMIGFKLFDKERRDKIRREQPAEWEAMIENWRSVADKVGAMRKSPTPTPLDKFYEELGCPSLPGGVWGHESPYLNLYLFPKEIDYDQDDDLFEYPPRWFRCDSLMRKPVNSNSDASKFWTDRLCEGMKDKKDMVFFSLGSLASGNHKLMQKYVDIFRKDRDRLYVISKGLHGNKYELDPNNMIGDNYIPQPFFLERANLAIVHGGNNSVFECLYFGVPMIVLPVFGDQNDNAQRIEDLGLGRRFKVHEINGEQLIKTIDEMMLDAALIERVRSIGEKMRARDSSTKLSKLLKKLLDDKNLDQRFIDLCREKDLDEIKF